MSENCSLLHILKSSKQNDKNKQNFYSLILLSQDYTKHVLKTAKVHRRGILFQQKNILKKVHINQSTPRRKYTSTISQKMFIEKQLKKYKMWLFEKRVDCVFPSGILVAPLRLG